MKFWRIYLVAAGFASAVIYCALEHFFEHTYVWSTVLVASLVFIFFLDKQVDRWIDLVKRMAGLDNVSKEIAKIFAEQRAVLEGLKNLKGFSLISDEKCRCKVGQMIGTFKIVAVYEFNAEQKMDGEDNIYYLVKDERRLVKDAEK